MTLPTDDQSNQAILYGFLTEAILPQLSSNGLWMAPSPAPLTADQVVEVFEIVKKDDHYRRQTLKTMTSDDFLVKMIDGRITRKKLLEED